MNNNNRKIFSASIPIILGYVSIGMTYGVLATNAGFSVIFVMALSMFVYAGASQFLAIGMMAQGLPISGIILATFIVNIRHMLMSFSLLHKIPVMSFLKKLLLLPTITDESFSLVMFHKGNYFQNFWNLFLLHAILYCSWSSGTIIGIVLAIFIPEIILESISHGIYFLFIALIVPPLRDKPKYLPIVLISIPVYIYLLEYLHSGLSLALTALIVPLLTFLPIFKNN